MNIEVTPQNTTTQQGRVIECDVLVIGTGLAGLHYCLQLIKHQPSIKIGLLSKANAEECNSQYAQGGIAAVHVPEDSFEQHILDTLQAGDGLAYPPIVETIIRQGPDAIKQLQAYSIQFSQLKNGEFALAKEGGHSHRRIFNCGDRTGSTVTHALLNHVISLPQVQLFENHIAINLISQYQPHQTHIQGEILGAYVLDSTDNRIHTFLARCVVLATGGAGKTYRYTSNPMIATGDGVAMAYRAGARVGNMEFYQFHPTLLHNATINNFLISEAVRGEGGILKNADTLKRFMGNYAPHALELATRDIVSRAIFTEIEQSQSQFVYLDITHQPKSFLKKRFPHIYETLHSIGIDMSQDYIPVVPAAHYQCGGILTDLNARTDLQRLYAIGEVAFTGLHGANRLASNSLLEAIVMASRAARSTLEVINKPWVSNAPIPGWSSPSEINTRRASQINAHWRSLRGEMTSYAGIVRTEEGLTDLLHLITKRHKIIEEYYWKHFITRDFIELRNIILNAELIVRSALERHESRGGHYREDFPEKKPHSQESIWRMSSPNSSFMNQ